MNCVCVAEIRWYVLLKTIVVAVTFYIYVLMKLLVRFEVNECVGWKS
jgi:hypothetical protein